MRYAFLLAVAIIGSAPLTATAEQLKQITCKWTDTKPRKPVHSADNGWQCIGSAKCSDEDKPKYLQCCALSSTACPDASACNRAPDPDHPDVYCPGTKKKVPEAETLVPGPMGASIAVKAPREGLKNCHWKDKKTPKAEDGKCAGDIVCTNNAGEEVPKKANCAAKNGKCTDDAMACLSEEDPELRSAF